jgi:hypothetical protein
MPTAKRNTIAHLLKITLNQNSFEVDNISCGIVSAGDIMN